eukprot:TRINITY_DN3237_c0_g1_i2.p1 TRINITY_DN3237_c0_g1~~TRINITY_DN3237_c0_g1_i2.p1  ORF type:complete len:433 (+),score=88.82 TRINITY_DN3237_c0_g1_i2:402-1700(+)
MALHQGFPPRSRVLHYFLSALLFGASNWIHTCAGEAMYGGTDVVELTSVTFKSKVLEDNHIWMVEFYAPWCGHCQRLKPEYTKAATASKGIVRFGAVNADEHKSFGSEYGIKGFPTLKIFGANKKKPEDYNGGRTAKAMTDALIALLPNHVTVLSSKTFDNFFTTKPSVPKAVLFTSKTSTTALYKALAVDLQERMELGEVRSKKEKALLGKYGLAENDLPALLAFPLPSAAEEGEDAEETKEAFQKYDGELKHKPLLKFLKKYALPKPEPVKKSSSGEKKSSKKAPSSSAPPPEPSPSPKAKASAASGLKQVSSAAEVEQHCVKGPGFCVITFLEGSDPTQVESLTEIAGKYTGDPLKFVWADASELVTLKALFSDAAGSAITAVVNTKRQKFALHSRGLEGLEGILDRAVGGDLAMSEKLPDSWHAVQSE